MTMQRVHTFTITLYPAEDGRTVRAVCHALADCTVTGRTKREALEQIEDRIRARLMQAKLDRKPVPVDRTSTKFLWLNVEDYLV